MSRALQGNLFFKRPRNSVTVNRKTSSRKNITIPKISPKAVKIACAVGACSVLAFCTYRIVVLSSNTVHRVDFSKTGITDPAYLSKVMFDRALTEEPYYDNEGNVVTGDGSVSDISEYICESPVTYQDYTVKTGDSISSISQKFGLQNISTLIAINNIQNVRYLRSGQKLQIPSLDGLVHTVSEGESLAGLSAKYQVPVEDILDINDLDSYDLTAGTRLFIPGAKLDTQSLQRAMGENFICPITASYRVSSNFGDRKDPITGVDSYHTGIDLACPKGTPIKAAMSGTVVRASWSNVFGNYVIIKHLDGYQTLYGHMSKIEVKNGAFVNQGTQIGLVGSTGYSTGPHLHFSVYKNGKLVNPSTLLKNISKN